MDVWVSYQVTRRDATMGLGIKSRENTERFTHPTQLISPHLELLLLLLLPSVPLIISGLSFPLSYPSVRLFGRLHV